jgi:hypothetical protein
MQDFTREEIARKNVIAVLVADGNKICKKCGSDKLRDLARVCQNAALDTVDPRTACLYLVRDVDSGYLKCSNPDNQTQQCSFKNCPSITISGEYPDEY